MQLLVEWTQLLTFQPDDAPYTNQKNGSAH